MNKIKEFFGGFDNAVITSRGQWFFQLLASFLFGIVIGILIAPPRKMRVGCNNGNNFNGSCCDCEDEEGCCCGKKEDAE